MPLRDYENEMIVFYCEVCEQEFHQQLPPNFEPRYLEEFGQYENLTLTCPTCVAAGRMVNHVLNLNLPIFEEEELEVLEVLAPVEEVNARQAMRKLMWEKRPDLKEKNRTAERERFIKENQQMIESTRTKIRNP